MQRASNQGVQWPSKQEVKRASYYESAKRRQPLGSRQNETYSTPWQLALCIPCKGEAASECKEEATRKCKGRATRECKGQATRESKGRASRKCKGKATRGKTGNSVTKRS